MSGQRTSLHSHQGSNNKDSIRNIQEDQKSSILRIYDAGSNWVKDRVGFVIGVITSIKLRDSSPGQLFTKVKGMNNRNETTRINMLQTALVLNSGATIHFFSNERIMKKNHDNDESVKIHCGRKLWNQYAVGELCDELKHLPLPQGPMYITKDGIGNLILLGQLAKHYQITLDTNIENAFCVYNNNGSYIKFECKDDGLYCLNFDDGSGHTNLMTAVKNQKDLFFELDVKRATLARYI